MYTHIYIEMYKIENNELCASKKSIIFLFCELIFLLWCANFQIYSSVLRVKTGFVFFIFYLINEVLSQFCKYYNF